MNKRIVNITDKLGKVAFFWLLPDYHGYRRMAWERGCAALSFKDWRKDRKAT